jgi:hypothetical protein
MHLQQNLRNTGGALWGIDALQHIPFRTSLEHVAWLL